MSSKTTITFGFPEPAVLAALGRLVIMHGHLEYILKMTFKSLEGISIEDALRQTNRKTGKDLRQKIQKIAEEILPEGKSLEQVQQLINRAWEASEHRNTFVHNVWGRLNFETIYLQQNDLSWRPAPSKTEIDNVANEISNILVTLNETRLFGMLAEELEKRRPNK